MSYRRIIFHIGTAKTGSTALQAFLAQNVDALRAQGIDYPYAENMDNAKTPTAGNLVPSMQKKAAQDKFMWQGPQELAKRYASEVIEDAVATSPSKTIVFSGEFMSTKACAPLLNIIASLRKSHRIDVFAFIRNPYDHMLSAWKQKIKVGREIFELPEWIKLDEITGYTRPIQNVLKYQPAVDTFTVANYDYHKHDISAAFFQKLEIALDWDKLRIKSTQKRNPSLTTSQAILTCLAKKHVRSHPLHAHLVKYFYDAKRYENNSYEPTVVINELADFVTENLSDMVMDINQYLPKNEEIKTENRSGINYSDLRIDRGDLVDMLRLVSEAMTETRHSAPTRPTNEEEIPKDFDPEAYLAFNTDVREAGVDPFKHYLENGRYEGRVYR